MQQHGIGNIHLVVVNLYPFRETVAKPGCTLEDAIENIDIDGPAMVRSSAKNHAHVAIVTDPDDYARILCEMKAGGVSDATRFSLAVKAFEHTAAYDGAIASYLGMIVENGKPEGFPRTINLQFRMAQAMRYGENPHQNAAFYVEANAKEASVATAKQLQGKVAGMTRITRSGTTLGTAAYLSPEQVRGEDVDHRADIWALGVVLHEMLTGRLPFRGEHDAALAYSILNEPAGPPSDARPGMPRELEDIVARCLEKDPGARYPSARDVFADLDRVPLAGQTDAHAAAKGVPAAYGDGCGQPGRWSRSPPSASSSAG